MKSIPSPEATPVTSPGLWPADFRVTAPQLNGDCSIQMSLQKFYQLPGETIPLTQSGAPHQVFGVKDVEATAASDPALAAVWEPFVAALAALQAYLVAPPAPPVSETPPAAATVDPATPVT